MTKKRVALIIANAQYDDPDLSRLVAPAQDATGLAKVLADPAIGNFEVETLLNENEKNIRRKIDSFFDGRKLSDLLLLYFSGHGLKDESGQLYFAASDTYRRQLRSTAVPANFINEVMHNGRARQQVLILDCCYSGAFPRGMGVKADQCSMPSRGMN
jgi:uncharacterized caspase-like protein